MLFGVTLNVALSLLLAYIPFKDNPGVGVAIATMATDVVLLIYLVIVSREYSLQAIINFNNLKIIIFGIIIAITTIFIFPLLESSLSGLIKSQESTLLVAGLIMLLIDALIYVGGLALVKEKLVSSIFRKKENNNG